MYCFGKDFWEEGEISSLLEEFLKQKEGKKQQIQQANTQVQEQPKQV